jgi:hypothetical protein
MAQMNQAIALAVDAAERIRILNQVTHPSSGWSGLDDPVDVYEVLGALATLADRLQQTTNQLGRFLEYRLHGGRLTVHFGTYLDDPPAAVIAAVDSLDQARILAAEIAQLISDAQAAVIAVNSNLASARTPQSTNRSTAQVPDAVSTGDQAVPVAAKEETADVSAESA